MNKEGKFSRREQRNYDEFMEHYNVEDFRARLERNEINPLLIPVLEKPYRTAIEEFDRIIKIKTYRK